MDEFSDDDLDDIPAATLFQLERQARLSTQQPLRQGHGTPRSRPTRVNGKGGARQALHQQPSSDYGLGNDEDIIDLDAQPSFVQQQYVNDQDKLANGAQRSGPSQQEIWRQQRYGQTTPGWQQTSTAGSRKGTIKVQQPPSQSRFEPEQTAQGGVEAPQQDQTAASIDVSALQVRIQELEQQAQTLQKAAEDARSAAYSKSGEIAVVRANQHNEAKEFDKKLKTLQQQHAEEVAKSKAALDAMRKEREKFETSNRFLEHDLARETERAKNARRTLKDGQSNANRARASPLSTPKKHRLMPLRDGFDDDEVVMLSPSKPRDVSKAPGTPKAGGKRKRSQHDDAPMSPGLSISRSREHSVPAEARPEAIRGHDNAATDEDTRAKFELMQMIIEHRTKDGRDRTLEALTRFYLPSNPNTTLASLVYDRLTFSSLQEELDHFRYQLCDVLLLQWRSCLDEKYYDPLYNLTELLQYILVVSPTPLVASLISRIVPLCQSTTDLIAIATAKALIDPTNNPLPTRTLKSKINPGMYLNMLTFAATHAFTSFIRSKKAQDVTNFWSHIEFDFILTILHRAQPLSHINLMLGLLKTSLLASSFGSIHPDTVRQQQMESHIVDRLTKLLLEDPVHPRPVPREKHFSDFLRKKEIEEQEYERGALPVPEPYTADELLELRSNVLSLLLGLALNEHGGRLIATHALAIGRLVRYLHEGVQKMYASYNGETMTQRQIQSQRAHDDGEISGGTDHDTKSCSMYEVHAQHINTIVSILYHLNTIYGTLDDPESPKPKSSANAEPILNMPAYLETQPTSSQRYLVALSRIAFSEAWGLEVGIDTEAAEMAHEMLDEFVSPEEGEGVLGVFGTGRTSGS